MAIPKNNVVYRLSLSRLEKATQPKLREEGDSVSYQQGNNAAAVLHVCTAAQTDAVFFVACVPARTGLVYELNRAKNTVRNFNV